MTDLVRERSEGRARTGIVNLRSFDQGVVETVGGVVDPSGSYYYLPIAEEGETEEQRGPVDGPPGTLGVPIHFSFPEEMFSKYRIPLLLVRRDDLAPAPQRAHPGLMQYRAPARGAHSVQYQHSPSSTPLNGWDRMEQAFQAYPFDLTYTLQIVGRDRGGLGSRNQVGRVLDKVLRVYQPNCRVLVTDSLGDKRSYEAFMEGTSPVDDMAEIADRVIGFAITLRVEGELDLNDPEVRKTVTSPLTRDMTQLR